MRWTDCEQMEGRHDTTLPAKTALAKIEVSPALHHCNIFIFDTASKATFLDGGCWRIPSHLPLRKPLWLVTPVKRSGQNPFTGLVLPIQRISTTNSKGQYYQFKGSVLPIQRIGTPYSKHQYPQFKWSVLPLQRIGTTTSKDRYYRFKGVVLPFWGIGITSSRHRYFGPSPLTRNQ